MNDISRKKLFRINRTRFAQSLHVFRKLNKPVTLFPAALLIFVTLGCRMFAASPHKSDAELIAELQNNKGKFNRLAEMVKEDKKTISDSDIKKGKIEGISSSRVEEYKKLLEVLNLLMIIPSKTDKGGGRVTRIYFKSTKYEEKGEYICQYTEDKGFMWYETGTQPANREVKNLDREYVNGTDVKAESRIDDNWSLQYSYETCVKD